MVSLFDLTGRTALVTGASRGLGAAACTILAEAGANIILVGREPGTLENQAERLAGLGARTHAIRCDMGDRDDVRAMAEKALGAFAGGTGVGRGGVDILVNNAGIIRRAPAENYPQADWDEVIAVNQTGPFLLAQLIGREMIARGGGKIINIASLLSFTGGLNVVAYTAAKSAVAGITRALANEWGRHGVNVNAIAPGYFHTEATAAIQQNPERYNALLARIPAGRWGDPADLMGTILFLASRASDYVNGQIIAVDGGWMAA
jgi:2-deoxy-D-gluconate 3-dehydrogenase